MSFIIRKGTAGDLDMIERLYGEVCDHMAATVNYCGWKRDVYPARQDAEAGIREGTLFLVEEDGEAAGSFILSPRQEAAYAGVKWQADLEERDVRTIYTFTVSPRRRGRGVFHAKRKRERVKELFDEVFRPVLSGQGVYICRSSPLENWKWRPGKSLPSPL